MPETDTAKLLAERRLDEIRYLTPPLLVQVFQTLHATGQSSMVRDWVLLSLSNFTQRTPVAMAMWSLTCFFVSASTSQWISALYPFSCGRSFKHTHTHTRKHTFNSIQYNAYSMYIRLSTCP